MTAELLISCKKLFLLKWISEPVFSCFILGKGIEWVLLLEYLSFLPKYKYFFTYRL